MVFKSIPTKYAFFASDPSLSFLRLGGGLGASEIVGFSNSSNTSADQGEIISFRPIVTRTAITSLDAPMPNPLTTWDGVAWMWVSGSVVLSGGTATDLPLVAYIPPDSEWVYQLVADVHIVDMTTGFTTMARRRNILDTTGGIGAFTLEADQTPWPDVSDNYTWDAPPFFSGTLGFDLPGAGDTLRLYYNDGGANCRFTARLGLLRGVAV